jgi:hypothetical protein
LGAVGVKILAIDPNMISLKRVRIAAQAASRERQLACRPRCQPQNFFTQLLF